MRRVPVVANRAFDQLVTFGDEVSVRVEIEEMVFNEQQTGAELLECKTSENVVLESFDVDRNKIATR